MMDIKTGTKTFSDSKQAQLKGSPEQQTMSALAKRKKFGEDKDLGQILNNVADPNYTDPSKAREGVGKSKMGKESFLKMLLAQLKNQDPTNPMKSHEMAAQLAQFTSLEKLTNIDSSINNLAKSQKPQNNYAALNLIGKAVSGDSSKITHTGKEDTHAVRFDLAGPAMSADLKIKNANGEVVRKMRINELTEGKNEVTWNGVKDDGSQARPGQYMVEIDAKGSNGKSIHAKTQFEGTITGVNFAAQGPVLMIGNQKIQMSDVKEIVSPQEVSENEVNKAQVGKDDKRQNSEETKKGEVAQKESNSQSQPQPQQGSGQSSMENVGLSRDMINKLKKQGVNAGL